VNKTVMALTNMYSHWLKTKRDMSIIGTIQKQGCI